MKMLVIALIILVVAGIAGYAMNVYKFFNCDFAEPYKCEVAHGVGTFIPQSKPRK